MSDRILPSLLVLLKIRKLGGNIGIDLAESCPLLRAVLNRHGDQRDVAEGRFAVGGGSIAVGAISIVRAGHGCDRGAVRRGRGGRGGCGRCRGIAIGGAVESAHRRRSLFVQMMVRRTGGGGGGGGVHGNHGVRAVQTVMGMVMVMMMAQGSVLRR